MSPMVASFIQNNIQSVWQLELLLFMKASSCPFTAAEAAKTLYMTPEVIANGMKHFESCGLLKQGQNGEYFYAPVSRELDETVKRTAETYSSRRVSVVNMIFSQSVPSES